MDRGSRSASPTLPDDSRGSRSPAPGRCSSSDRQCVRLDAQPVIEPRGQRRLARSPSVASSKSRSSRSGPPRRRSGEGGELWFCRAAGLSAAPRSTARPRRPARTSAARAPLERSVTAWLEAELTVLLAARRSERRRRARRGGVARERSSAALRGELSAVERPRLSTTYDGDGRVLRCGIELWEGEEAEYAQRLGGDASAGGELIGTRRRPHARGVPRLARRPRELGLGRYDITERWAAAAVLSSTCRAGPRGTARCTRSRARRRARARGAAGSARACAPR